MKRAITIVLITLAATPAAAQLFPARQFSADRSPLIVDVDQDGIADIVTTRDFIGGGKFGILLGVGDGTFVKAFGHYGLDNPTDPVAGDFNRDGIVDLAAGNSDGGLRMCPGLGGGRFGACTEYDTGFGSGPRTSVAADFNGDGWLDVAGTSGGEHVIVSLNNRFGGFHIGIRYRASYGARGLAVSDLDRDGILDLAIANSSSRLASVLMGIGDGTFAPAHQILIDRRTTDVAAGDFNGDDLPDLVLTEYGSSLPPAYVYVLLGRGDGTFDDPVRYDVGESTATVAVHDVDADGHQDLLVGENERTSLWLLKGIGDGTFADPEAIGTSPGPYFVSVGDLDGENGLDLVTQGSYYQEFLTVLLSDGDGGFETRTDYPAGDSPGQLAVADFNSDGEEDIIHTHTGRWANDVSLHLGNGDGSFVLLGRTTTGQNPLWVAVGDVDADGHTDAVTADFEANSVTVLRGRGDATFDDGRHYPVGTNPRDVVVGDLDRDGRDDVVSVNGGDDTISVLLARPNGSLVPAVDYPVGDDPDNVALADFDGDDVLDLAINNARGGVQILVGVGDGTFAAAPQVPTATRPLHLAVGDLNEDGKQDIVLPASESGPSIAVLLGRGDATFDPAVYYELGDGGYFVVLADADRDSHLDAFIASWNGRLYVMRGAGDGTLGDATSYAFPADRIAVSDFNGDHLVDIAGTNNWSDVLSVMLGPESARAIEVTIDIRPRSINPGSPGVIPVVVFGSQTFDVRELDVATLGFGPSAVAPAHDLSSAETFEDHLEDTNEDGFIDLMLHFRADESGIACGATRARLVGETLDGQRVEGWDEISTVPCRPKRRPVEPRPAQRWDFDSDGRTVVAPVRRW
jgi:hypothetical protein